MGYLKLSQIIVKNSVSRFTQYRSNALTYIGVSILWIGLRFIFIDTIFSYTDMLGGWTKEMVWTLVLLFPLIDSITQTFFGSMWGMHDNIVNGQLDGTLVKPKSALFLTSFSEFSLQPFTTGVLQLVVFIWALVQAVPQISIIQVLVGVCMVLCAISIQFSITLLIVCIGFWFPRTENLLEAWYEILGAASYPLTVLPRALYQVFLTIVPVALVAFVPASAFLGVLSGQLFVTALAVTVIFLSAAIGLWCIAIKRYSSASS
jgi:ABC-2 type transport system permease protein